MVKLRSEPPAIDEKMNDKYVAKIPTMIQIEDGDDCDGIQR